MKTFLVCLLTFLLYFNSSLAIFPPHYDQNIGTSNEAKEKSNENVAANWKMIKQQQSLIQRKTNIERTLGQACLWCFSYSTRRSLDCLRRNFFERYLFLQMHMCLFN